MPAQKLYTRFLRQLLPLLALAYVLTAALTTWLYYQNQRIAASNQRSQTLDTFAHVLVKPLWDCNSLTAEGIIQAMTLQPNVRGASVLNQCTQKLIQAGTLPDKNSKDTLSTPLQYVDEMGTIHMLGELQVAFQPQSIFTAAARSLVPQLAVFLSMLAVVLACTLWTFRRIIGAPLLQLCQAMHRQQALDPIPDDWADEISEVTRTYNTQLQELRHQARHDPLTGLGNRLRLEERLEHVKQTGTQGHVLLLDLDRFKPVNDTFGHAAGDEVLRTVAQRLLACVRDLDTVVRLGGDEFAIIAPDTIEDSDADALVTRITHALTQPILWRDTPIYITPSIGRARFGPDDNDSNALLALADADMYRAKGLTHRRRRYDPAQCCGSGRDAKREPQQ